MSRLALLGGPAVRSRPFPAYRTIGEAEKHAVQAVLDSGVLSQFLGTWSPEFFGGPQVTALEREWETHFGVKHAIAVNSATSGLYAAVGAVRVSPGDEVIVSPYTMSASAAGILVYGGIPVFADIDPDTFCISPESVAARLSPYTKAIVAVDLFGHPADMDALMRLARDRGIRVIEDAAQAAGAYVGGRAAGTVGDIGVFSLNYHKTIHAGEGGVVVTNDDDLATRVRLIRNHAEAVVKAAGVADIVNLVGFNYRMTEIEAAIGREQLRKLDDLVAARVDAAAFLTERLKSMAALEPPVVRRDVRHGYYVYAMRYRGASLGISRERFVEAVRAEGVPLGMGYVEPLYTQPVYQRRIAFGDAGYPFTHPAYRGTVSYDLGICPVTERMHECDLLHTDLCHGQLSRNDLEDVVAALEKVVENADDLRADP